MSEAEKEVLQTERKYEGIKKLEKKVQDRVDEYSKKIAEGKKQHKLVSYYAF